MSIPDLKLFLDEYHPSGATEGALVQTLADTSWRMNRVAAMETNILALGIANQGQFKGLANLSLYSDRLSRQFESAVIQLRDLQKARSKRMETKEKPTLRPKMASFFQIVKPRPKSAAGVGLNNSQRLGTVRRPTV